MRDLVKYSLKEKASLSSSLVRSVSTLIFQGLERESTQSNKDVLFYLMSGATLILKFENLYWNLTKS